VEAGLRTGQKYSPFPEEVNRAVIDVMSDLHFAPTEEAHQNLLRTGVSESSITVTGNTAIDAVLMMERHTRALAPADAELNGIPIELAEKVSERSSGRRLVLVTGHRRESFGDDLESICRALLKITEDHDDVELAYPVHLNPRVRESVFRLLGDRERIWLFEPPAYSAFIWLLSRAHIVITDSGGIQEEAPALNKPVLVTRRVTERAEGVAAGCAKLVGVGTHTIVKTADMLLSDEGTYRSMATALNPFGDGHASERISDVIEEWWSTRE
jgi:UDP-N-acetylglucosamine 2-epimerase